ncbi:TRAP transporter substrate-binding protein [Pseudoruegeria sp. SK021]|uniref:TRAP transporter substrate-binding protein n=1 Tax=Pseudoruegeria sp. SK021 TaxID=1933035 RepID=UPI000A243044|nr:TRAP transporter substrate-binding protein [Pseudoruegeria sp. SK021]OSP55982.1 C4-dicarboxylate ABC transporter substrate-binding protein [Pseudoruegeria sp. SK021]
MQLTRVMTSVAALATTAFLGSAALAQEFTLRLQSHYAPETTSGKLAQQFIDDVQVMSQDRVKIEMFWSSSVVKSVEGFDAAASGILDGEMHGGAYQTGKNPAFQFVGDIMGGYDTPWQQYAWLYNGGKEVANELYNQYGMELIGWWIYGQESLASTKPLAGPEDLKDWKFRSPPGLETEIFANLGAKPIVMDFTEIFTALETGIIDGADASGLANNVGLGLYDIATAATYPGFHSMPSDHLTINKNVWDGLPEDIQRIIDVAMQKLAFQTALTFEVANNEAAAMLREQGVTLYEWSAEDRAIFRKAAQDSWQVWADKTPEARALVDSHVAFLNKLGLISN